MHTAQYLPDSRYSNASLKKHLKKYFKHRILTEEHGSNIPIPDTTCWNYSPVELQYQYTLY